jgi:Uma2 family endonuclease
MLLTDDVYERLALDERHRHWELHDGRLVEKPGLTAWHAEIIDRLYAQLRPQLPLDDYAVRVEAARLRRGTGSYFEADLTVVPRRFVRQQMQERPAQLEVYSQPVPLVVEVRSPSTSRYDVNTKIPEYQRRGDLEIWRIQHRGTRLTAWRREPDGSYSEASANGGILTPIAFPGVTIDLDALFSFE